jgi:hypothetical protein
MMNWKGRGRKRSGLILKYYAGIYLEERNKTTKTSVKIAGLRVKIWIWELLSKKQDCYPLDHDVR